MPATIEFKSCDVTRTAPNCFASSAGKERDPASSDTV